MSGGSVKYANCKDIKEKLVELLSQNRKKVWKSETLNIEVLNFLLELWCIHPFRERNTRTCITFIWHYLREIGIDFQVELLRNNPRYVRDSLVMASYDQKEYLQKILDDALKSIDTKEYTVKNKDSKEQYQIAKEDYQAFKEKYKIKK